MHLSKTVVFYSNCATTVAFMGRGGGGGGGHGILEPCNSTCTHKSINTLENPCTTAICMKCAMEEGDDQWRWYADVMVIMSSRGGMMM